MTCETCRYRSSNLHYNADRGTAEFPNAMYACKRRAPIVTGGMHNPTNTAWPMVSKHDWCGEHTPNPETPHD